MKVDPLLATVAIGAVILFMGMAGFQLALAAGAPLGDVAWGGRYQDGLPSNMRITNAVSMLVLLFFAAVVLARSGLVRWSLIPARFLGHATWIIVAFMALNTLGNVASSSSFERLVFGPTTAVLCVLCGLVARKGGGPTGTLD